MANSNNMEIDSPTTSSSVFLHPLALIHMSDQYTRVRWGGSPLDAKAPVVGILFGTKQEDDMWVQDAGDIPLAEAQPQIDLHQAVFPKHAVLGWYKVVGSKDPPGSADSSEPTAQDLKQTQQIQSLYQKQSNGNAAPATFFGLLQVPNSKSAKDGDSDAKMKMDESKEEQDDDDDEEELPLTLYRLEGSALVAVPTWSLQTAESERIAVQRVIREKAAADVVTDDAPTPQAAALQTSFFLQQSTPPPEPKAVIPYTAEVQESCTAIATRLTLILDYLDSLPSQPADEPATSIASVQHLAVLRQVQGLLLQLGPIAATVPRSGGGSSATSSQLQQLASLAQAVDSVTLFVEKFRFLHEHHPSSSGGGSGGRPSREVRRF